MTSHWLNPHPGTYSGLRAQKEIIFTLFLLPTASLLALLQPLEKGPLFSPFIFVYIVVQLSP